MVEVANVRGPVGAADWDVGVCGECRFVGRNGPLAGGRFVIAGVVVAHLEIPLCIALGLEAHHRNVAWDDNFGGSFFKNLGHGHIRSPFNQVEPTVAKLEEG